MPETPQSELTLEEELKARGLNAPRVTPETIESMIESVEYFTVSPSHVICKISMLGGRFHVTGESSTVSAENFDPKVGEDVSYRNAREKIWPLAGVILAHELYNFRLPLNDEQKKLDPHIQRVIVELNQVLGRLKSLVPLLADKAKMEAIGIPLEEIALLEDQAVHMKAYADVLQQRLSRVGL